MEAAHYPPPGTPVPEIFLTIFDGNAFPSTDTMEARLTLHTSAGLLQFHMSPAAAAKIGSQLLQLGSTLSPPGPAARR